MTPSSTLTTRLTGIIREQRLLQPDDRLIVGISGGADSTALLDLLANLPAIPLRLVAAHLNHGLREAESDADEEFCRKLAEQYRIPFESRRVDVKTMAAAHSLNLEDAGRRARVAFFNELLVTWQATAIALAHHADDQAETVLMRLLRGSGLTGLSAMSYRNDRGYIRPLLNITREELEVHLTGRGQVWREDATNQDRTFLRNRIRHELLPLLEQYNPAIRTTLAATAAILSGDNDLLDSQATQTAKHICHGATCSISPLTTLPLALQRRIIRLMLSRLHGNLEQFTHSHIDDVCRMATTHRPNATINLPQGVDVVKEYDQLVFKIRATPQPHHHEIRIAAPGEYHLPYGDRLTIEPSHAPPRFTSPGETTAYFDLEKAPFPWHVRNFLPGDRIQPLGMTGRKKLKDLFIDSKIPLHQRGRIPLIFSEGQLIWVCGLRTSQHARLDDRSNQIIKVVISRAE